MAAHFKAALPGTGTVTLSPTESMVFTKCSRPRCPGTEMVVIEMDICHEERHSETPSI